MVNCAGPSALEIAKNKTKKRNAPAKRKSATPAAAVVVVAALD
jgi:hypothetical protein